MACMVKADQHSENAQRLQTAGNKVKKAADVLVKAAQSAAVFDEQEVSLVLLNPTNVRWLELRNKSRLEVVHISPSPQVDLV